MNMNGVVPMIGFMLLGLLDSGCKPRSTVGDADAGPTSSTTSTALVAPKETRPQLPPDPPPPSAAKASEAASEEAKMLADPNYQAVWDGKRRDDLHVLLTAVSETLATLKTNGEAGVPDDLVKALEKRKLMPLFWSVIAVPVRIGSFSQDFVQRLNHHLETIRDEPHAGLWASAKGPTLAKDFAALAWFVNRDSPDYAREFLSAKRQGPISWTPVRSPWLPYLSRERSALERLALLTTLTPTETARLAELRTSKLGDTPPEEIKLSELLREYGSNEVRADDAYRGHVVEFSGVAGALERGAIGGITLAIGTGKRFETPQVHCFFEKSQTEKVKALNRGDRVRVRGKVDGLMMNVLVRYCELVE